VWARLKSDWLAASRHRVGAGASYEIYLNNPMNTPKEKLETEICIPIE
jgi:effector-binding domain-containing protein